MTKSAQPYTVNVREATEADTETIIWLIKELAIYEKEPQEAKATPALVRKSSPRSPSLFISSG